jgi:DNA-binding SARP family transcriptional activator
VPLTWSTHPVGTLVACRASLLGAERSASAPEHAIGSYSLCDHRRVERVDVRLLSEFQVRVDGQPISADAWTHGRARDLVKLLALATNHRLPRDRVLDALWPQLGADAALANLHKAAHHARRALGQSDGLVLREGMVMLAPNARVETDVERFEASSDPALYTGDLLPDDPYAEWAEEQRQTLRARSWARTLPTKWRNAR